jgi:hypothetical protein
MYCKAEKKRGVNNIKVYAKTKTKRMNTKNNKLIEMFHLSFSSKLAVVPYRLKLVVC